MAGHVLPVESAQSAESVSYLLRGFDARKEMVPAQPAPFDEGTTDQRRGIFCRRCGYRITDEASRVTVNNSHTHTFFNPAGLLFELACFREASGCSLHDVASSQFTWFAGYQWRLAFCRQCSNHLGWRFESHNSAFFCLIIAQLKEGP